MIVSIALLCAGAGSDLTAGEGSEGGMAKLMMSGESGGGGWGNMDLSSAAEEACSCTADEATFLMTGSGTTGAGRCKGG
jgi:hypothetical protein